ncbi:MAG: hypothetical protein ACRDJC_10485 [Thermomicrobiales bacterium]
MAMTAWDQLGAWLSTLIVASLTWVIGALAPDMASPQNATTPGAALPSFMLGWAQEVDQPPIEQVGEGTDDVETLDEGAPPVDDGQAVDEETLDAGLPPAAPADDVETLDQGAPPAAAPAAQPVDTTYVAPVADTTTTYVAPEPAAATGPVLPEGFGTGRVHAAAGRTGVPVGLEDCHVGAVTGRAYVGVDCGEDGAASFVGHAPSFEAFPFVLEAEFPFEGDEAFFTDPNFPFGDDAELTAAAARDDEDDADTDVFVSAGRGARDSADDDSSDPVVEAPATTSVQFAQRARDREPRVRIDDRGANRKKDSGKGRSNNAGVNAENSDDDRGNGESRKKSKRKDSSQDRNDRVGAESDEKKSKDKKDKKQRRDRKQKRDRS